MYEQAGELTPEDFEVWGALGDAYRYTNGNKALAEPAYLKAIELGEDLLAINRSDARTMATLAQYYANTGNAQHASALLAEAEELEPRNMDVHYFSAVTNTSLGKDDAAVRAIKRAVELGYPTEMLQLDAGLSPIIDDNLLEELLAYGK